MAINKTLTNLVCSTLAAMALNGEAKADFKVELYPVFGARSTELKKEGNPWREIVLESGLHSSVEFDVGRWAYSLNADMNANDSRGPQLPSLGTQSLTLLGGRTYASGEDSKWQLLAGVDGRFASLRPDIVREGMGDGARFYNDREGKLRDQMIAAAISPRYVKNTDISERVYSLICSYGLGNADEAIIKYFTVVVDPKNIKYHEASVEGRLRSRKIVQRKLGDKIIMMGDKKDMKTYGTAKMQPEKKRPFIRQNEYGARVKFIGQNGGYNNLSVESDFYQFYPATQSFDLFGQAGINATLYGVNPEDITSNGNKIFGWKFLAGFRLKRF